MADVNATKQILDTLSTFGLASFSTKDFIDVLKKRHPKYWDTIESEYGVGGANSGKPYSSNSHVSQVLNRLFKNGKLTKLEYAASPPGWGNRVIRFWTLDRNGMGGTYFADETDNPEHKEGDKKTVTVNKHERNPAARLKCIEHHGLSCSVCELRFEEIYGPHGAGFIHVHHRNPFSKCNGPRKVDPVKDLIPVCPNFHSMIHYKTPMLTITEARALLGKGPEKSKKKAIVLS